MPTLDLRTQPLTIGETAFLPASPQNMSALKAKLVELQSFWLEMAFSTGEVVANERCWRLMQEAVDLLPRKDNPAMCGCDIAGIANDYAQLEALFFAETKDVQPEELHGWSLISFDLSKFSGCRLTRLNYLNPVRLIQEADALRVERGKKANEPISTERKRKAA